MSAERLFMITVAAVLGLSALVAAIHNHDVYYRLPKARLIEDRWGRTGARLAYVVLGLVFLALGATIAWQAR